MLHAHSLVKVPHECLNRCLRPCQKACEKDTVQPIGLIAELSKKVKAQHDQGEEIKWDKVVANLDRVEERFVSIKRKLEKAREESEDLFGSLEKRLAFGQTMNDQQYERLIVADHLIRKGHTKGGLEYARKHGLGEMVDPVVFQQVNEIVHELKKNKNLDAASDWCAQNKSRLKKMDSSLEFHLRKFGFLKLVEEGKHLKAVQYAKKYLAPFSKDYMEEIQEAMASLAFYVVAPTQQENQQKKKRKTSKKGDVGDGEDDFDDKPTLIQERDWDELIKLFERDSTRALSLEMQTTLQVTLKAGLASLHTPKCWKEDTMVMDVDESASSSMEVVKEGEGDIENQLGNDEDLEVKAHKFLAVSKRNINCPCCAKGLKSVAVHLPIANKVHSSLICRISGKPMNQDNPPMALPNGQVFSLQALKTVSEELGSDGSIVVCPISGAKFPFEQLTRVFIT